VNFLGSRHKSQWGRRPRLRRTPGPAPPNGLKTAADGGVGCGPPHLLGVCQACQLTLKLCDALLPDARDLQAVPLQPIQRFAHRVEL